MAALMCSTILIITAAAWVLAPSVRVSAYGLSAVQLHERLQLMEEV